MEPNSVYQRAVTPTMTDAAGGGGGGIVRGKMLSYQTNQVRRTVGGAVGKGADGQGLGAAAGSSNAGGVSSARQGGPLFGSSASTVLAASVQQTKSSGVPQPSRLGVSADMNVQGRAAAPATSGLAGAGNPFKNSLGVASGSGSGSNSGSSGTISTSAGGGGLPAVPGSSGIRATAISGGETTHYQDHGAALSLASLPRYDLYPLSEEIPSDGIIFAKVRNQADSLVVFRTPEERLRNPERLNLDRRQLDICPLLEQEQRLRLLNFQNNSIRSIQNLENLPNLIFLDIYNNKLASLEGPLSTVKGLRVLMAGKNRISTITNLTQLRKLDVLDLHSNEIRNIEGLDGLTDLRVLNLAGNRISIVQNLSSLQALTELNLRRNSIDRVHELDKLPALQRIFLSHNLLVSFLDIQCLFNVKFLVELSLDGNPLSESDPSFYRNKIVAGMAGLRHLDLKRITESERSQAQQILSLSGFKDAEATPAPPEGNVQATIHDNSSTNPPSDNPTMSAQSVGGGDKWTANAEGPTDEGRDANNGADSQDSITNSGLAALARAGRISAQHCMIDLELIAPNEKALVAVGDGWEWVQAKRLLVNVVEASLLHMRKEAIMFKFSPNIASLPALRSLRLINNDLETLREVGVVLESLGRAASTLEHLFLLDNLVCSSSSLLRHYVCGLLPSLKTFNDVEITTSSREESAKMIAPVLRLQDLAGAQQISLVGPSAMNEGTDGYTDGGTSRPVRGKGGGIGKRPGGSIGQRTYGNSVESQEASIDLLVQEIAQASTASRLLKSRWEEAFGRAIQNIVKEAALSLGKL